MVGYGDMAPSYTLTKQDKNYALTVFCTRWLHNYVNNISICQYTIGISRRTRDEG